MSLLLAVLFAAATQPDMIVSTDWLAERLDDPNVIILEVGNEADFNYKHILNARFIPREKLLITVAGVPDEMPPVAQLERTFSAAGIGNEGRIVIYSRDPLLATRTWFTLDYLGHGNRAALLDGGFAKWDAEVRPTTYAVVKYPTASFVSSVDPTKLVTMEEMKAVINNGQRVGKPVVMFDARPVHQFIGHEKGKQVLRAGHIANANCAPWTGSYTKTYPSVFKSDNELREFYNLRGVSEDASIVVYCRTGVEATTTYFVLRHLGYTNVALYDGSYTEWSNNVTPIAVAGPAPSD